MPGGRSRRGSWKSNFLAIVALYGLGYTPDMAMTDKELLVVLDSMARALTIGSRMANDARIIEFEKGLEDEPPNSSASDGDARRKMTPLEIHQRTLTHSDAMATCILVLGNRLKGKQPYSQIALARALGTFPEDLEALDLPTDDKVTNRKRNNASIIPERLGKKGYGLLDASHNVGSGHSDQIDATELLHDIFANDLGPSFERLCEKTLRELRKLRRCKRPRSERKTTT